MATTPRGVPYPGPGDPDNVPVDMHELAQWLNDHPGISALSTTARNALAGVDLWDGRLVFDTTLRAYMKYDDNTDTWGRQWEGAVATYDSSVTWTKPTGPAMFLVEVWSGGGGGANPGSTGAAGGGGGGGYRARWFRTADLGATESITIGVGGAGGIISGTSPTNGSAGGTTSFGSHISVTGGKGGAGTGVNTTVSGGDGGGVSGGKGGQGATSALAGSSTWGGGGGGSGRNDGSHIPGNSECGGGGGGSQAVSGGLSGLGGAGGAAGIGVAGAAGTVPGGGGGASGANAVAGAGANGRVRITSY
ncbi:hypothetical protein [Nocardioides sp. SR21]|uniref:glycine-rich domain-containing protein n=1 Tax=Nocardioides sp. SR21 TaxID=2919501 RepID=UPI001FAA5E88|nr:hypothetical protein [Nocardioides sp. SR21]